MSFSNRIRTLLRSHFMIAPKVEIQSEDDEVALGDVPDEDLLWGTSASGASAPASHKKPKTSHVSVVPSDEPCPSCGKIFASSSELEEHFRSSGHNKLFRYGQPLFLWFVNTWKFNPPPGAHIAAATTRPRYPLRTTCPLPTPRPRPARSGRTIATSAGRSSSRRRSSTPTSWSISRRSGGSSAKFAGKGQ